MPELATDTNVEVVFFCYPFHYWRELGTPDVNHPIVLALAIELSTLTIEYFR